jgi:glycosyltransferase involved in cell wall biosynthesis
MTNTAGRLVSVIIPTYNHAQFLGRALESVLNQTYTNWEAIVIDNYSTDNTDDVMRRFTDSRINYLNIHNNGVIAASRNMGIRAAKGEWIAFLDSDDWWTTNKLQVCLEHINDSVDIVHHDLKLFRDRSVYFQKKTIKGRQVEKPVLLDLLLKGNAIANSSAMVRKRLLDKMGGIDESAGMIGSEDYNTWLRLAQETESYLYIPQTLGFYMQHGANTSSKNQYLGLKCSTAEFMKLLSVAQQNSLNSAAAYLNGRYQYRNGEYKDALQSLKSCLAYANRRNRLLAFITLILIATKLGFYKTYLVLRKQQRS